jgi:hypothetical protein
MIGGLESLNGVIKTDGTLREQLQMLEFMKVSADIIHGWSRIRDPLNPNVKVFEIHPKVSKISDKKWKKAIVWRKNTPLCKRNNRDFYAVSSSNNQVMSDLLAEQYTRDFDACNWTTWDAFKLTCLGVWHLTLPPAGEHWTRISCTCPSFAKKYICTHTIGLAMKLGFVNPPERVRGQPLIRKTKTGRKLKAKRAYSIMPFVQVIDVQEQIVQPIDPQAGVNAADAGLVGQAVAAAAREHNPIERNLLLLNRGAQGGARGTARAAARGAARGTARGAARGGAARGTVRGAARGGAARGGAARGGNQRGIGRARVIPVDQEFDVYGRRREIVQDDDSDASYIINSDEDEEQEQFEYLERERERVGVACNNQQATNAAAGVRAVRQPARQHQQAASAAAGVRAVRQPARQQARVVQNNGVVELPAAAATQGALRGGERRTPAQGNTSY